MDAWPTARAVAGCELPVTCVRFPDDAGGAVDGGGAGIGAGLAGLADRTSIRSSRPDEPAGAGLLRAGCGVLWPTTVVGGGGAETTCAPGVISCIGSTGPLGGVDRRAGELAV